MNDLLSQVNIGAWSVGHVAIAVVILLAIAALVWVAIKQFGVKVPQWVIAVAWICVAAVVIVAAIRFVMTL